MARLQILVPPSTPVKSTRPFSEPEGHDEREDKHSEQQVTFLERNDNPQIAKLEPLTQPAEQQGPGQDGQPLKTSTFTVIVLQSPSQSSVLTS